MMTLREILHDPADYRRGLIWELYENDERDAFYDVCPDCGEEDCEHLQQLEQIRQAVSKYIPICGGYHE